jgi:hypothetical protein
VRALAEIAPDIALVLRLDPDEPKTARRIEQELVRVRAALLGTGRNPPPEALAGGGAKYPPGLATPSQELSAFRAAKADFARERERLARLRKRHARLVRAAVAIDAADRQLRAFTDLPDVPDSRFDWVKNACAHFAKDAILKSRHRRLGGRLRELASLYYEAFSGEREKNLSALAGL